MKKRYASVLLLLTLSAIMLGACGDDKKSDDSASVTTADKTSDDSKKKSKDSSADVNPCDLVTKDEVATTFGGAWGEADLTTPEGNPLGITTCTFANTDGPPVKTFSLSLQTTAGYTGAIKESGLTAKKSYEASKQTSTDAQEIDLGDDAFQSGTIIHVLKDDVFLSATTFLGESEEAKAGLKSLTEIAVKRLP